MRRWSRCFWRRWCRASSRLSLGVNHEVAGQAEELAKQWRARREQAAYEARRDGRYSVAGGANAPA